MISVVHVVLDALAKENTQPEPTRIHRLAVDLWQIAKEIKKANRIKTIFSRTAIRLLVSVGLEYAVKRGFIPEKDDKDL